MESTRKRNIAMTAAAILLCLVLATTFMVSGMLARYTSADASSDTARPAAFVFYVGDKNASRIVDLQGVTKPGDQESYTFLVKNSGGSVTSEVSETAYLTLSLNGSIPLTCTVTESGQSGAVVSLTRNAVDVPDEDTESACTFSASVQTEKTYVLTVLWPAGENDIEYASAGTVAKLVLTVTGVQVD